MTKTTARLGQVSARVGLTAVRLYLWRFLSGVYQKAERHHLFLMSGGLAFSLLFCIVPFGLVAFAVLGLVLERTAIISEIGGLVDRAIPYPEFAGYIKSIIFARAEEFRVYKNVAGVIGLLGLLLAASGLFSSMRTILNSVFRASGSSIYKAKIRDLGVVLLVLGYFVVSIMLVPMADLVLGFADKLGPLRALDIDLVGRYLVQVATILLILVGYTTLYFLVPERSPSFRIAVVAGLSATVLWFSAKELFGLYMVHAANLRKIYGTYVVVVLLGLWIYYSSLVFVMGGIVGQVYREMRAEADTGTLSREPTVAE